MAAKVLRTINFRTKREIWSWKRVVFLIKNVQLRSIECDNEPTNQRLNLTTKEIKFRNKKVPDGTDIVPVDDGQTVEILIGHSVPFDVVRQNPPKLRTGVLVKHSLSLCLLLEYVVHPLNERD